MKPRFAELFFASRYMLPLWMFGGLWLWFSGHAEFHWQRFDETDRGLLILVLCAMAAGWLKALPKVWAYEQAQRDYAAAGRDPEQVKRRRRQMLWLLACASWGGSLWWVSEQSYTVNPNLYRAALVIVAGGSLWAVRGVYSRLAGSVGNPLRGFRLSKPESFVVRCALPVPKRAPNPKEIHAGLPDYCKMLLASRRPEWTEQGCWEKDFKLVGT